MVAINRIERRDVRYPDGPVFGADARREKGTLLLERQIADTGTKILSLSLERGIGVLIFGGSRIVIQIRVAQATDVARECAELIAVVAEGSVVIGNSLVVIVSLLPILSLDALADLVFLRRVIRRRCRCFLTHRSARYPLAFGAELAEDDSVFGVKI